MSASSSFSPAGTSHTSPPHHRPAPSPTSPHEGVTTPNSSVNSTSYRKSGATHYPGRQRGSGRGGRGGNGADGPHTLSSPHPPSARRGAHNASRERKRGHRSFPGSSSRTSVKRHRPRARGGGEGRDSSTIEGEAGPSPGKKRRVEGIPLAPSEDGGQAGGGGQPVTAMRASSSSSSQGHSTALQSPSLSSFAQLHATLNSPEAISSYLKDAHRKELMLTDVKTLQTFIAAALSGRSDAMWEEWITNFKADVYDILFALYSFATTPRNKATSSTRAGKGGQSFVLRPSSHEFLIQLERHGVRRSAWEASLSAPPYNIDTSLLSPKAMLKQLAALDPFPRLQRWIEMSHTAEELYACGEKMKALWSAERTTHPPPEEKPVPHGGEETRQKGAMETKESVSSTAMHHHPRHRVNGGSSVEEEGDGGYESWCALLSKWISKMRRVADRRTTTAAAPDTQEEKGEEEEEDRKSDAEKENQGTSLQDSPAREGANDDDLLCHTEQREASAIEDKEAEEEEPAEGEKKRSAPQHTSWTEKERKQMRDCMTVATELLGYIMDVYQQQGGGGLHSAAHLRCPTGKLLRYAEWATPLGLLRQNDAAQLRALDEVAKQSLFQAASQMEIVGRVKEIPSGDSKALAELLDELWEVEEGGEEEERIQKEEKSERAASLFATTALARVRGCFMPPSSDVLSSIVTAVSATGIDPTLEELTVRRLIATQHALKKAFQEQQRNAAKRNSNSDSSAPGTSSAWSGVVLRAPQLPRRALRLIEKYAQKERQAALTKRIDSIKGNKHEKVE